MPSTPTTYTAREASVTIVVPVYNNAGSLPALHGRLKSVLVAMGLPFEIIYVNDASSDGSLALLSHLHASEDEVTLVDLAENAGQSAAVLAALTAARGDIVVTIDADLENHPEDIPKLVAAIRNGADVACGARRGRSAPLLTRRGPSVIANRLVGRALGVALEDWGCGLNAGSDRIVSQLLAQQPLPSLPKIEAILLASQVAQVPVEYSERAHGRSTYTVRRLASFAARFLRAFAIRRSLRRLLDGSTVEVVGDGALAPHSSVTRTLRTATGLGAWAILSAAALATRAWSSRASSATPFRIREILRSRAAEPSPRDAPRNRPHDLVSRRR
jgi:glycosyltransferase involved in cell wall biosynthesis